MYKKILGFTAGIIGGLYLYSIAPNKNRKNKMLDFEKQYIAHRGLFNNETDAPENSIPAFQKAVEVGYGIELDVQLTTDHQLVVFHDESLKRMCGIDKTLTDCSFDELSQYTLGKSEAQIPLLKDVLKIIDGQVPIIVEIKPEGDWKTTTKFTAKMLDKYNGCYCIESFHPLVVRWFRKHRPDVIRGQLSTNYFGDHLDQPWYQKFLFTNLMLNFITKPDFIAYNHLWKNNLSYTICRTLFPVENVAWTIRSQEELLKAKKTFDIIIFDSFIPDGNFAKSSK